MATSPALAHLGEVGSLYEDHGQMGGMGNMGGMPRGRNGGPRAHHMGGMPPGGMGGMNGGPGVYVGGMPGGMRGYGPF